MENNINILLIDNCPVIRYGIKSMLNNEIGVTVYAAENNIAGILSIVGNCTIDIVILDILIPSYGIELTKILRNNYPNLKILNYSNYDGQGHIVTALQAGVQGCLSKRAGRYEILNAIKAVMQGKLFISKKDMSKEFHNVDKDETEMEGATNNSTLSKQETKVIRLIGEGYSYKEIAMKLAISKRTVDTHKYNISKKIGIISIAGIIRYTAINNL